MISRIALSFTSGRTVLAIVLEREASSRDEVRAFLAVALGDHHEVGGGFRTFRLGRRSIGVVDELDVADVDPVVLLQRMLDTTGCNRGVVDERLVPRFEIDHAEAKPDFADLGMPPAHSVGSQNDVALRQAADHRHVASSIQPAYRQGPRSPASKPPLDNTPTRHGPRNRAWMIYSVCRGRADLSAGVVRLQHRRGVTIEIEHVGRFIPIPGNPYVERRRAKPDVVVVLPRVARCDGSLRRAASRACYAAGSNNPTSTPTIAITTNSSIRVKPDRIRPHIKTVPWANH